MTTEALYKIYLAHPQIQTDTRKLKAGDFFFALSGPNFNGNDYIQTALDKGAAYCVSDDQSFQDKGKVVVVDDVLQTLQALAIHHRDTFSIPFIGITGSNGKTTTKELLHAVLSKKYRCYTTEGNLNNHIGVPLTILKIKQDAEIAIIEMGANHIKEIESYCTIAKPTHGLITNCGKAHLEGFGSEENIKIAKGELFDFLSAQGGTAFINNDLFYLIQRAAKIDKQFSYGSVEADVKGNIIPGSEFLQLSFSYKGEIKPAHTQLVGDYNFPNALAAAALGFYFDVNANEIVAALEQYEPGNSRSQFVKMGTNTIVLDAYNANPNSMKLAIENFAKTNSENKILYIGAMKEMGIFSEAEHTNLIALIQQYKWEDVILVGEEFTLIPATMKHFYDTVSAKTYFNSHNYENKQLLIKGSRGLALEKLLEP